MKVSELFEAEGFKADKTVYGTLTALENFARETVSDKDILEIKRTSLRVWTRGDGSRFKEPINIQFRTTASAKKVFALLPGKTIEVSNWSGTSEFTPAKKSGGMLFVLRDSAIYVSADSVLRNKEVWKTKQVSEAFKT